ncbi:hypothetical protein GCM10027167_01140 [Nocardia heshunensis]
MTLAGWKYRMRDTIVTEGRNSAVSEQLSPDIAPEGDFLAVDSSEELRLDVTEIGRKCPACKCYGHPFVEMR